MVRAAPRYPPNSIVPILTVLGAVVLGWAGLIALHAVPAAADANGAALDALPPALRRLVYFCGTPPDVAGRGLANWMLGWTLMVVAMMLPPALPLLRAAERLVHRRPDRNMFILLMLGAFVGVWIMAGALLFAAGSIARVGLNAVPAFAANNDIAAAVAAIAAGLFQFTPFKTACMDACRSPASIMIVCWHGGMPLRSALSIGTRYGAVCVGCCWAMMTLGILVGALMLPIMVVCALLMSLERMVPAFRPLVPLQASFAIAVGGLLLVGAIPPISG
jgi:predicted metal-binding membrane protein